MRGLVSQGGLFGEVGNGSQAPILGAGQSILVLCLYF